MESLVFIGGLISTCIATFVGAYAAFKLEEHSRKREKIAQQASEGNLALLTIFLMWNQLREFQKQVIEVAPKGPGRWLRVKATIPQSIEDLRFNASRLDFLFECEDKNILAQVLMEGHRFQLAMTMIDRRAHLMLEQVFPKLAEAGIKHGQNVEIETLRTALGPALWAEGEQITDGIVTNVKEDVASLKKTFADLRGQLLTRLPGQKFIRVSFDAEQAEPSTKQPLAQPAPATRDEA